MKAEVLVIGAGISGALIAEMLVEDGHEVIVVDRRGVGRGSTAASTSLVQYDIDNPLSLLSRQIGSEESVRAFRRAQQAVAGLAARTQAIASRLEVSWKASLYLSGDVAGLVRSQARGGSQARRRLRGPNPHPGRAQAALWRAPRGRTV